MRTISTQLLLLATVLVACSESPKSTDQFVASWSDPVVNSAKSYWYDGETDNYYVIVEKWAANSIVYHVSKDAVVLKDVASHDVGSGAEQINLKLVNVMLTSNQN